MSKLEDFALGDTVRVLEHSVAPYLYPDRRYTVEASEGWVVCALHEGKGWPYTGPRVLLKKFVEGQYDYASLSVLPNQAKVLVKGDGTFKHGANLPLSPRLIWEGRIQEVRDRWENTPVPTHQGYSNVATWMAHFYLDQDKRFQRRIAHLRRKDGTINPSKLEKLFYELHLDVDDWALQPHIEIPDDLKRLALHRFEERIGVNWAEVAAEFAAAPDPTPQPDTESIETQRASQ